MQWLNTETRLLHAPEYIGSDPRARATWLNLSLWCASQENGGVIKSAAKWKDRQWQQTCGVTSREVLGASPLVEVVGEDVVVWNYPTDKEAEVQAKRESGRKGGNASAASRASTKAASCASSENESVLQRKGKEGKGKEEYPLTPLQGDASVLELGEEPTTPKPPRARDPLFDALAKAEGSAPDQLTTPAARAIGVALANIKRACPGLTADEINRRAQNYRRTWPNATITASALSKNWARFGGDAPANSTLEDRFANAW